MRIDYHADRAFQSSNVFRFLVMVNREKIALFPAIEVECVSAWNKGSDSLLMQFEGCLAL